MHSLQSTQGPTPQFQRIQYEGKKEICYLKDFLDNNPDKTQSFYKTLDLTMQNRDDQSLEPIEFRSFNDTTDYLERRILQLGQIDHTSKITKKVGNRGQNDNYYDQGDSFIDHGNADPVSKNKDFMAIVYAQYDDFEFFEGSPAEFAKSNLCKDRVRVVFANGGKEVEDSKKKPADTTSPSKLPMVQISSFLQKPTESKQIEKRPLPKKNPEQVKLRKKLKTEKSPKLQKQPQKPASPVQNKPVVVNSNHHTVQQPTPVWNPTSYAYNQPLLDTPLSRYYPANCQDAMMMANNPMLPNSPVFRAFCPFTPQQYSQVLSQYSNPQPPKGVEIIEIDQDD